MRLVRLALPIALLLFASAGCYTSSAQLSPLPVNPVQTVASDASALAEITAFQTASGLAGWIGLSASGTVLLPGSDAASEAKLWISNGGSQRLDISAPNNGRSIRMLRGHGVSLVNGTPDFFFDQDLAFAGLVQLPALLPINFKNLAVTAKDLGTGSVGITKLHHLALTIPTDAKASSVLHKDHNVDLYFDPVTHLLKASVALVHLFGPSSNLVQLATSYDDYRAVGASLTPFQITQTIDGQPYWTVRLTTAAVLDKQDPSLFAYSSK